MRSEEREIARLAAGRRGTARPRRLDGATVALSGVVLALLGTVALRFGESRPPLEEPTASGLSTLAPAEIGSFSTALPEKEPDFATPTPLRAVPRTFVRECELPPGPGILLVAEGTRERVVAPDLPLVGRPLLTRAEAARALMPRLRAFLQFARNRGGQLAMVATASSEVASPGFDAEGLANLLVRAVDPPARVDVSEEGRLEFLAEPVVRPAPGLSLDPLDEEISALARGRSAPFVLVVRTGHRSFKRRLTASDLEALRNGELPRTVVELRSLVKRRLDELAQGAAL